MINAVKNEFFGKYADFKGRTNRKDFWLTVLGLFIIGLIFGVLLSIAGAIHETLGTIVSVLVLIFELAVIIPGIAIEVRRLHDIGKSGWWLLLAFVPFGSIVLLVFYCMDSK